MSISPTTHDEIVTTLRAAGCVFAEDEALLLIDAATTPTDLAAMVARRSCGVPLEQVLGWAEFCGLRIAVEPGVFVPRKRTEFLVHRAAALASSYQGADHAPTVVVDLCCGTGAVGVALAAALAGVEMYAVDIDPVAVRCARRNIGVNGHVYQGDLFQPLPERLRGRVDVLVANAPYVPTAELWQLPPEARLHEPRVALDGGTDGLDVLHRVVAEARVWLAPGGHLLVEASDEQAPHIEAAVARSGLTPQIATSDELAATVVIGTSPTLEGNVI